MSKISSNIKRRLRNRKKLKKINSNKYRVSVMKSLNHLSAQIIDDIKQKTLVSASSVGTLAEQLIPENVNKVSFSWIPDSIAIPAANNRNNPK